MTLFDLAFLLGLLITLGSLPRATYLLLRRRRNKAVRVLTRLLLFAGAYMSVLVAVSIAQPKQTLALGRARCFDEWCIVVDNAQRRSSIGTVRADGQFIIVSARVLNQGRRRRQRETDVGARLLDDRGFLYVTSARGQAALVQTAGGSAALTDFVNAGSTIRVQLVFDVPNTTRNLEFLTVHSWFPHALIIDDAQSVLHEPVVVPLFGLRH
ncbi:MAG: hypothetical protein ABI035_03245 [Gemmatimonadaceae bacterium]